MIYSPRNNNERLSTEVQKNIEQFLERKIVRVKLSKEKYLRKNDQGLRYDQMQGLLDELMASDEGAKEYFGSERGRYLFRGFVRAKKHIKGYDTPTHKNDRHSALLRLPIIGKETAEDDAYWLTDQLTEGNVPVMNYLPPKVTMDYSRGEPRLVYSDSFSYLVVYDNKDHGVTSKNSRGLVEVKHGKNFQDRIVRVYEIDWI